MTRVKPTDGARVRYPSGQVMPPEGDAVNLADAYWHRRLADGDIQIIFDKKGAK